MTPASSSFDPRIMQLTTGTTATASRPNATPEGRARAQAEDLESVFVSTMFQSMFTAIDGDGPMGSSNGVSPWRSFLTQEYAKTFVQRGGIGLADHVYRSLIAQQEVRAK